MYFLQLATTYAIGKNVYKCVIIPVKSLSE